MLSERKDWGFFVGLYGWFADVDGTAYTDGQGTDVKLPFEDILEQTESGLQVYAEAWVDKWYFAFDGTWADLGVDIDGDFVGVDVAIDQQILDFRGGREVLRRVYAPTGPDGKWERELLVDLYFGARYFSTDIDVNVDVLGLPADVASKETRWDPYFGARAFYNLTGRWLISGRADIGGFGIGDAADFTWQTQGDIGYRITRAVAFVLGYRALFFDTAFGSGDNLNGVELLQQGPFVGIGIGF